MAGGLPRRVLPNLLLATLDGAGLIIAITLFLRLCDPELCLC